MQKNDNTNFKCSKSRKNEKNKNKNENESELVKTAYNVLIVFRIVAFKYIRNLMGITIRRITVFLVYYTQSI